jgi:hypothetical protein
MKKNLLLTIAFILTILFGAWLSESIKVYKADQSGYTARYLNVFGRNVFSSPERGLEYEKIRKEAGSYEIAKDLPEWNEVVKKDYAGHAQFEIFAMAVMWVMSAVGLLIFIILLRKSRQLNWKHYVAWFLSLFFMRPVVLAAANLCLGYPCGEAKALLHYNIEPLLFQKIVLILGLLILVVIVAIVPKKERLRIVVTGAIGSIIGLLLWLFCFGLVVFG